MCVSRDLWLSLCSQWTAGATDQYIPLRLHICINPSQGHGESGNKFFDDAVQGLTCVSIKDTFNTHPFHYQAVFLEISNVMLMDKLTI